MPKQMPNTPTKLIQKAHTMLPIHVQAALSAAKAAAGLIDGGAGPLVFLGMSGGVDSSVSAYLLREAGFNVVGVLKEEGYEVTGVFIKVWQPEDTLCTWKDDRRDAMRVCAELGIPFRTLDLEDEYKRYVADYMIREYAVGNTPNPDIMCNKHVKFGGFFKYAMSEGADFVATGHYAQTRNDARDGSKAELVLSADEGKDQTYFLWAIPEEILPKAIFPVGALQKDEVREIARHAGLPVSEKKDSQGVCFIGKLDMKGFLKEYLKPERGDVCDLDGKVIGSHEGAVLYTIGERHGFTIANQSTDTEPRFVVRKDIEKNILYIGSHSDLSGADRAHQIVLGEINFLSRKSKFHTLPVLKNADGHNAPAESKLRVRLRHRQPLQDAFVSPCLDARGGFGIRVRFESPQQGVASGQSCVLYDGDVCLGGGIIQ